MWWIMTGSHKASHSTSCQDLEILLCSPNTKCQGHGIYRISDCGRCLHTDLIDESLTYGDGCDKDCVQCEHYVIQQDGVDTTRMGLKVFCLHDQCK